MATVVEKFREYWKDLPKYDTPCRPGPNTWSAEDAVDRDDAESLRKHKTRPYMEAVGALMWLTLTRPDLLYAVA